LIHNGEEDPTGRKRKFCHSNRVGKKENPARVRRENQPTIGGDLWSAEGNPLLFIGDKQMPIAERRDTSPGGREEKRPGREVKR